jgi:hypothetical protein
MDGTVVTRWMCSTTMEGGTTGAPLVAHILGSPCKGAWRLKMAVKWQYGLNSDRVVIMDETAQKRLWQAPVVSTGCPGM